MSERSIGHDGLRFRCRVDGPEGGPWVVFSNSLATDLTFWDAQAAALALGAGVAALQDDDLRPALGANRLPVLLLTGSEDGAMPTSMPLMAAAIPGSRFVALAGAGHLPPVEQPELFTAALQDMLP